MSERLANYTDGICRCLASPWRRFRGWVRVVVCRERLRASEGVGPTAAPTELLPVAGWPPGWVHLHSNEGWETVPAPDPADTLTAVIRDALDRAEFGYHELSDAEAEAVAAAVVAWADRVMDVDLRVEERPV